MRTVRCLHFQKSSWQLPNIKVLINWCEQDLQMTSTTSMAIIVCLLGKPATGTWDILHRLDLQYWPFLLWPQSKWSKHESNYLQQRYHKSIMAQWRKIKYFCNSSTSKYQHRHRFELLVLKRPHLKWLSNTQHKMTLTIRSLKTFKCLICLRKIFILCFKSFFPKSRRKTQLGFLK